MNDILTDDHGRPFARPDPRDFDDVVAYLRAFHAYRDAVATCANRAFDGGFRKAIARGRGVKRIKAEVGA